jgi:molybdenum cofactor biosynthesis enzyme MoaA
MEIKGKILCKKSDNKAFKMEDNWYNVNDNVIPILEKISKGDFITVQYEKKGISRYVSKLSRVAESDSNITNGTDTAFICEVCGKVLKDGTFKKCYMCNKSGATKKASSEEESTSEPQKDESSQLKKRDSYYNNPEKTAQIQRGNALNAAASVASSQQFPDPDIAKQFTLILADSFLEWLRNE